MPDRKVVGGNWKKTMHCNLQIEIFDMAFSTHTQKGGNLVRNQNCHHIKNNVRATNTHTYSHSQVVMCAWACANIAFELFFAIFQLFWGQTYGVKLFSTGFPLHQWFTTRCHSSYLPCIFCPHSKWLWHPLALSLFLSAHIKNIWLLWTLDTSFFPLLGRDSLPHSHSLVLLGNRLTYFHNINCVQNAMKARASLTDIIVCWMLPNRI